MFKKHICLLSLQRYNFFVIFENYLMFFANILPDTILLLGTHNYMIENNCNNQHISM